MKLSFKKITVLAFSLVLFGCAAPGSYLTINQDDEPQNEETSSSSILDKVNIYQLTANQVGQFNPPIITAQKNALLDKELSSYEYLVGSGDILNITVWDHPELTIPAGSYRSATESGNWVHANGHIFYPYIGFVEVAGKSTSQIRELMSVKLSKFIESPQVDVSVAKFQSKKVYVTGAINMPGQQFISNVPLTLLDAINSAGGLSEDADWRNVSVTRLGSEEILSLYALIQKGDLTHNRLLKDGDIVHVPRNDNQKVFVMGEVNNPQLLKIDRAGMSLTEALSSVGGINQLSADATGVFVIRSNKERHEGSSKLANVFQLDISNSIALVIGTEFELMPKDIVYVTAAPVVQWNRVISQIIPTSAGFNNITDGINDVRGW
ncbi:putative capsular polysaccharide transport protein [Marinomonas sp. MED121]|uniref:polysaccharide export protein n=1 Tax=Marinomonas sp. MED121 TaxID=314277 RepID=UPI0000690B7A|nr:polysaccharide export protein [Marinomonas sp. MED121]EAQ66017.1 putative capsular polysaccharide transport protein [Marinomonas sp. MED121]